MVDLNTKETLVFPFNKWLSRTQEDREMMREQPARKNGEPILPCKPYDFANMNSLFKVANVVKFPQKNYAIKNFIKLYILACVCLNRKKIIFKNFV